MHLHTVEHGHALPQRLMLGAMRLALGGVPDVVPTLLYRRELFAAFVSRQNQCSF